MKKLLVKGYEMLHYMNFFLMVIFLFQGSVPVGCDVPRPRSRFLSPRCERGCARHQISGPHCRSAHLQGSHCHRHPGRGDRHCRLRPVHCTQPEKVCSIFFPPQDFHNNVIIMAGTWVRVPLFLSVYTCDASTLMTTSLPKMCP